MSEHEQRSEDEVLAEQQADAVEDLDVSEEQRADVGGEPIEIEESGETLPERPGSSP